MSKNVEKEDFFTDYTDSPAQVKNAQMSLRQLNILLLSHFSFQSWRALILVTSIIACDIKLFDRSIKEFALISSGIVIPSFVRELTCCCSAQVERERVA